MKRVSKGAFRHIGDIGDSRIIQESWHVRDTLATGCQQVTDCRPTVGPHFDLKHNTICWLTVNFGNYISLLPKE